MSRDRSKVAALPGPVKAEVDRLLQTGRFTLDDIIAHLQGMAETGAMPPEALPSRSGMGRYAQKFERVAGRMRMAQEIAQTWQKDLLKDPESDVSHAILNLLEMATFQAMAAAGETEDGPAPDDLELLGRAVKHLEQSKAISHKRILELTAAAEAAQKRAVEEERKACVEIVGRETGLSAARIRELQIKVGGLRDVPKASATET